MALTSRVWFGAALVALLSAGSARAEPVKQLSHRDRLYDIAATPDGQLIVVGHPGLLLRSRDGGKSFDKVQAGQVDEALFGISFNSKGQGAVVGRSGYVLTTQDRGKTWHKGVVTLGEEKPAMFAVSVLEDGSIVAVGEFGSIARSEDQGKTWTRSPFTAKVAPPAKGQKLDPACQLAGEAESENDDVVPESRLTDVAFFDDKVGLVTAEFGLILRTEDGGRSFKRQNSCADRMLYSVSVIGPKRALAVGAEGTAVETLDSGLTWSKRETGSQEHLFGVFANERHAIVLGAAGVILTREGDGPLKAAVSDVHGWLTSAWLDAAGNGVAVGGRGYLRTTQDGGKTRQRVFGE
jgi:photosystem II stability/assembly factor-like uncharacterized protein